MRENSGSDVPVPSVLTDICIRPQGLVLLVGNRFSKVEETFEVLQKRWVDQEKRQGVLVLREGHEGTPQSSFEIRTYQNFLAPQDKNKNLLKQASVLIFENVQNQEEVRNAINLYEEGRTVIVHVSAPSLLSALHRVYGLAEQSHDSHLVWRLVDGLVLLVSQTRIANPHKEAAFAHEIVLVSPEVKQCLWSAQLSAFEELMKNAHENSGVVTLNQSLLQLLIRRKIEIKTAFEVSRDPVDLDHMLKKVGL